MSTKKHTGSGDGGQVKEQSVSLLKPDGRFNTVHLLPIFLNLKESSLSLAKPSIFNNEMQMSAEDRIHKLIHTREKIGLKGGVEPRHFESFHCFPRVVVFQNFHPGKVYKVPLSVRNACQVIKNLQIAYEESQHFSVSFTSGLFTRVAPGMSTVLTVHFTPEDKKDYSYQIALQSNKESFKVPVIAIGPRPLLDFPDDIHLPPGPIKIRCTKVVLVRNIGDVPAIFSLSTNSPFDVEPRKGVLRPSEMMNVRISVIPKIYGNVQGQLKICYETGETLFSQIYGVGEEANVWMDKRKITIEETYVGVKQMTTVTLHNDSDHLLNFKWKKMATVEDELVEYDKLLHGFSFLQNLESKKYSKLCKGDIIDPDTHSEVYNRLYDDEVRSLKNEEFLFNHKHFMLRPLCGDIWPKSSIDIIVVFDPDEPGEHSTTAFCDIPGHDQRLPLIINGFVKGPQFQFNLDVLDADCVFVSKPHCYEVVAKNIGLIPGTLTFIPTETQFGGKISCEPESVGLLPEECKSFLVTFISRVQGEFIENIIFKVTESDDRLQIDLKGSVVSPTLKFSEEYINFGTVPFGFPTSYVVLLQNLSMVQVNYRLSIKGDGTERSISYRQFAESKEKPRLPKNPQEYNVSPVNGTVAAYSSTKVKITLTGNVNREKKVILVLDLLDSISEPILLPISHTAAFPNLTSSPSEINIRFCFINYTYTRSIILENESDVMGFFIIIPQSFSAATSLMFTAPLSQGIIKPKSKMKIPITILINSLGIHACTVSMLTLGDDAPKEICTLSGCGQGPVMTAEPHILDYGRVNLLSTVTKEFILTNDSPVPANFSMSCVKKNSPWAIIPQSGTLPAEKNIVVEVPVYLRDTGRYKDTLQIEVYGSKTLQVLVSAEGVGTSLVIHPVFTPVYDLGFVLTNKIIERKFDMNNEGNRNHQVLWSPSSHIRDATRKDKNDNKDKKEEPAALIRRIFHFHPPSMLIQARQSSEFIIKGYSDKERHVSEEFFCHATVGTKKEVVLRTHIKAHFIDPKVTFSVPEVTFKIDIKPGDKYKILYEKVEMTNATKLPYKTQLRTEYPFFLMGSHEAVSSLSVALDSLATIELTIIFDTSCVSDLYSRKYRNFLQVSFREHIHMEFLPISGEVNFPNINIFPDILDFGCIPIGASVSEKFEIVNEGHLPVNYRWYWLPDKHVDYADECHKKISEDSVRPETAVSEDIPSDEKSLISEHSLDKKESIIDEEVDIKVAKLKKRKKNVKVCDEEIKATLFPFIAQFFEDDSEEQALQCLPEDINEEEYENKYFDITPWYGHLKPYESQSISARFSGTEPTIQCGVLVCKIDGGPSQVLLVRGEISDLEFALDKTVIDIGCQIFSITTSNQVKLTNVGDLPFDFSINLSTVDDLIKKTLPTCLKIEPNDGYLSPKQSQILQVDFTPGSIKKFNKKFTVQVGYLDPITITLKGFGVIPQLYVFLPRPKSYVAVIDIGYEAVDSLLEEYLAIENMRSRRKKTKKQKKGSNVSLFGRNLSRRELKGLIQSGWTVITYEDKYPTVAEVDLAIEKLLAQDHIDHCGTDDLKNWSKCRTIPGLIFPAYDIDFGIVVVGMTVSYSALLYNYGPIAVSANFQYSPRKHVLRDKGFSFNTPTISQLNVDQTVSMQILFTPPRSVYIEKKHDVEFLIFLEVMYGARIPIQVHAVVTYPYLIPSEHSIHFETINCGEQKTAIITLRNEGLVPCNWHGKTQEKRHSSCFAFTFPEPMSTILPNQTVDVSVMFKPSTPGFKESVLHISIEDSDYKLDIPLTGVGEGSRIILSNHVLEFEPTLPYPEQYIKSFKVKNVCSHPVEFYLPHLDSQILEEEKILRVLCDYYQTDRLCLPIRHTGDELPKELSQFYQMLVGLLRSIEADQKKKKKRSSRTDKLKVPVAGSPSQTTVMTSSQLTLVSETPQTTQDQIEEALHEHMNEIRQRLKNSPNNDPVKEANDAVNNSQIPTETTASEGLVLIFHGAPQTDSVFIARKTAKSLNLKLLSIDNIILEAAATAEYPEAIKLKDQINLLHADLPQLSSVQLSKDDIDIKEEIGEFGEEEEDDDIEDFPIEDPIEEIKSKVKLIVSSNKKPEGAVRGTMGRGSIVASQQSYRRTSTKKSPGDGPCGTIPGISLEMLEEILRKRIFSPDCLQGSVIDQLNSMFFDSAALALTSLLRAVGFIKYVHIFIFYNTFEQFSRSYQEEKSAAEEAAKLENEKKLALLETLSVEEVEELSEEDQALYWNIVMAKRKEDWLAKKNEEPQRMKSTRKSLKDADKKKSKNKRSSPTNESKSPTNGKKKGKKGSKGKIKTEIEPPVEVADLGAELLASSQSAFISFESEYSDVIGIAMNWDKKKSMVSTNNGKQANNKGKLSKKAISMMSQSSVRISSTEPGNQTLRSSEAGPSTPIDESIVTWIFNCENKDPHIDKLLISLLVENEEFNSCRPEPSRTTKQQPTIINWCAHKPDVRNKINSFEEFIFCNYEGEPDDITDDDRRSIQKSKSTTKRRAMKKKGDSDASQNEAQKVKSRWVLNPEEEVEIKIQFDPHSVGEYEATYPIEVVGKRKQQHIKVRGMCDLPRIDMNPTVLFDHVVETKETNKLYRLTYFLNKKYFDFGAILATKAKDKRLHHIATSFHISNCSSLNAEVRFSFLDKTYDRVDAFAIEPVLLNIEPNSTENVTVFATPRTLGLISETIMLSITDNPALERIKISCTGVKVEFEVEPRSISFDHVLVFRKDYRMVKLINKSLVPIIWHFVGLDDAFLEKFDISSTEGLIMPLDDQDIRIEFFATQVISSMKKQIKIEVFDEEGRGDPILIDHILVSAESIDVIVDISFTNPRKNYVDFGKVKVGSDNSQNFYLKNKGKHDVKFRVEVDIPPNADDLDLKKILSVRPAMGTLVPGDGASPIEVKCHPNFDMQLFALPVFKCYLLDRHNVVATIPIQVSFSAQQCSYEISPVPNINFGTIPVGTKHILPLTIKNSGVWEISYNIVREIKSVDEITNDSIAAESAKTTEKKTDKEERGSKARAKSFREKISTLKCGIFTITPSSGTVGPGKLATIQVECFVENEGTFSEGIIIEIPEKTSEDLGPVTIELMASACAPFIDFSTLDSVFEGIFVCEKLEEIECPRDIQNHNVLVKGDNKFLFSNTCLGMSNTARLMLQNPGLVLCEVNSLVRMISSATKAVKSSEVVFSVTPIKLSISPYSTEYLELTFTPNQIGRFIGFLEVALETSSQKDCQFTVQLVGEGCMPIVSLIEPQQSGTSQIPDLVFHPTLLGKTNVQKVVLLNSGSVSCNVRLKLRESNSGMFSVKPNEETFLFLVTEEPEDPDSPCYALPSGHRAVYEITFMPIDVGKFTESLTISIIGNPYENIYVNFVGECYTEDVTLDLPSFFVPGSKSDDKICEYALKFDNCYVDTPRHISFKIHNHSQKIIYKFVFGEENHVKFSPNVGHLKPGISKEITATLLSPQPVEISSKIDCQLVKIRYDNDTLDGTSWDSRLRTVHWKEFTEKMDPQSSFEIVETERHEGLKYKVVENEQEPKHENIPNSEYSLPLEISAIIGYTSYACDFRYYEFPETLMFHSRSIKFTLANTGNIPLTYNWNVIMDEKYPRRVHSETPVDFLESQSIHSTGSENREARQNLTTVSSGTKQSFKRTSAAKRMSRDSEALLSDDARKIDDYKQGQKESELLDEEEFIFSPSESIRSIEAWSSSNEMPFMVEPPYGSLEPEQIEECTLTFLPKDILEFQVLIIAVIPHLDPNLEILKIIVKGQSLMPVCYFKMDDSDYLTSGKRDLSLPGPLGLNPGIPLHSETKVVEFKIVGICGTHSKKLIAINPTDMSYNFSWENVTLPRSDTVSMFYCTPLKGTLDSDREMELQCNFIAHDIGTYESFWNFTIPDRDTKYYFLFVSHVSEPSVCFLSYHVELCPTVIGITTVKFVPLISNESIPLKFEFDPDSLQTVGNPVSLDVTPMKGKIVPGEETLVKLEFTPKQSGIFHFHLKCHVKGMKKPLSLEVTGECYPVQPVITFELEKNQVITLSPNDINVIQLGEMNVKCPKTITFTITNIGKITFYYYWQYDEQLMKKNKIKINFQTKGEHITSQSRASCNMTCTFLGKSEMNDFLILLQISKGPDYKIILQGCSTKPNYEFSSLECNFGMCFFKELNFYSYKRTISIKNYDSNPVLIECLFENTPYFTLENANGPIAVNEEKIILISFTPQGLMKYEEIIEFLINGCIKQKFTVAGEGIEIQVCLQNPQNKLILFAPVLPGGYGFACAPVINNSRSEVNIEFRCGKKEVESHSSSVVDETIASTLVSRATHAELTSMAPQCPFDISPTSEVNLKPKEVVNLCIKFQPTVRMKLISENVYVQILDNLEPLCILQGSCVGPEFSFDRNLVAFGSILKGCSAPQKLKLINSGEVGARYKWESGEWSNFFQISPMKGYSSPDTETVFSIVFSPKECMRNIHLEAVCSVDDLTSLSVRLTGACWQEPVPKEDITFSTPVRSQDKKTITLDNTTSSPWNISPQITGQYFYGPEKMHVPPSSVVEYEMSYTPLVMTTEDKHTGTVVFCLPEGNALAYNLIGTADKPSSSGKITKDIPCKEHYTEVLHVSNWLTTSQRFMVTNEISKLEKIDPVIELSGNDYIDVPGKSEREYKWTIFCYKECTLNIKVIFTNVETDEYLFYDVCLKVMKRGPLETVNLITAVRETITHKIDLHNPLSSDVNYFMHCPSGDIDCKTPIIVPAYSKSIPASIKYTPIFVGESTVTIELFCNELGSFPYDLQLKALPPIPEKLIKSTVAVGSSTSLEATVINMTRTKVDFLCKVDNNDFETDKLLPVAADSKGNIVVNFEPTSIGNISATLTASSAQAGDFQFPLLGIAIPPKPQGPFSIKFGGSISIPFKNIFHDKQAFTYVMDCRYFLTKTTSETIRPKKETRITVHFSKSIGGSSPSNIPVTGKLTVFPSAPDLSHIKWVFYLKGIDSN